MAKSYELSWNKLQESLSRHTISTTRRNLSSSAEKLHPLSSRSRTKSIISKSRTLRGHISINNSAPSHPQLQQLYYARCLDLNIPHLSAQADRFQQASSLYFKNRKITLKDMGLGVESAKILGKIISKDSVYFAVSLSQNNLGNKGVSTLSNYLQENNSVVHIDLSSNSILPEGFVSLFSALKSQETVVSVDVHSAEATHRNILGIAGASSLSKYLASSKVITHLNIGNTQINKRAVSLICAGLRHNKSLLALDLSDNNLISIKELCEVLNDTSLEELHISGNKIGNEGCEDLSGILHNSDLLFLDISNNLISSPCLPKLWEALGKNVKLFQLKLDFNDFSKGLSPEFELFMTNNRSVKHLSLAGTGLTDVGMIPFNHGLIFNHGLVTLNLSKNYISNNGVNSLVSGLKKNKQLTSLNLSSNKIKVRFRQNNGSIALANLLKVSKSLRNINLKENKIKEEAVEPFVEASRFNKDLLNINLKLNNLDNRDLNKLGSLLKKNNTRKAREVVPNLKQNIEFLSFDTRTEEALKFKMDRVSRDKNKIFFKREIKQPEVEFEDIKEQEIEKTKDLQEERKKTSGRLLKLNQELENSKKSLKSIKAEYKSKIQNLDNLINFLDFDYKKLTGNRRTLENKVEFNTNKRNKEQGFYNDKLELEKVKLRYAQRSNKEVFKTLKELKQTVSLKGKTQFLATEKLAESKIESTPKKRKIKFK